MGTKKNGPELGSNRRNDDSSSLDLSLREEQESVKRNRFGGGGIRNLNGQESVSKRTRKGKWRRTVLRRTLGMIVTVGGGTGPGKANADERSASRRILYTECLVGQVLGADRFIREGSR